jgi:hypothetical protein
MSVRAKGAGCEVNFLKFLNFRGTRNGRKFNGDEG